MRLLTVVLLVLSLAAPAPAYAKGYKVSARSAIFSNSTDAVRYYGKNVHRRLPAASTVKVMTALLVLEHLPLGKVVTVSHAATLPEPSKIYVKEGEHYRVGDLLYALLLQSANDAAVVLAEAVAGSEAEFARMMNDRARALGAKRTKFINANGLPVRGKKQYSTAYDMYLIFRQAVKHPFFRKAVHLRSKVIYSREGRRISLASHNRILFKDWDRNIYGKTGWTRRAGQCFVGYIMKGNDLCIISIYGATRRWEDIRHIVTRYGGISL